MQITLSNQSSRNRHVAVIVSNSNEGITKRRRTSKVSQSIVHELYSYLEKRLEPRSLLLALHTELRPSIRHDRCVLLLVKYFTAITAREKPDHRRGDKLVVESNAKCKNYGKEPLLLAGCLTSQQRASVSQGRICSDNFTCCHTEIEVADQTFHLTQPQYTDTGPTSPSTDPITPGVWQGSHWSAKFEVTGMTRPQKNPVANGIRTRDLPLSRPTP